MHMVVGKGLRPGIVNTGIMYVQNASSDGPVAWMLGEAVQRNLRWIEHNVSMPHMAAAAGGSAALLPRQADTRGCWDQFLLTDVLLTGMLRRSGA